MFLANNVSCFKNHPFSNKLALYSLNKGTIEISAVQCLSICQFKIGQGECMRKKWIASSPASTPRIHPHKKKRYSEGYENGEMVGVKKLLGPLAAYERIGPIRVVGFRTRGTINPGGFAMEFLRSWSELGVALRLELRFDLSPTASHATAITHRPLISIFRPVPSLPIHPPLPSPVHLPRLHHRHPCSFCFFIAIVGTQILECLRYSMLLHTSDLDPIDRHELIVPQILCRTSAPFPSIVMQCLDLAVMI